ncbi:DUF3097 domain-containing protein [Corynebacterium choanae]|uniref:DUF3097 domain-containing protein n=1 Tax=Corynebacterium choanae TaxID=1862358 RepID=A0A3G6J6L4_9CORY|nr:DUF3097 domain-containing protein [Corynebacterium choanae]AZA13596.1 hypothetical protein CCHOA_05985 [Corynebacterium choanae]
MAPIDRYAGDIFAGHSRNKQPTYPTVPATMGLVVEVIADDFVGAIIGFEKTYDGQFIRLEDRRGVSRLYPLRDGAFLIEGVRSTLVRDTSGQQPATPAISNSGSRRVSQLTAKVAAPSRIWVEGVHDAAIVEKVWGHDLRVEGVVVEYLEGLDNLEQRLQAFAPSATRRVGVLADHLVQGSKEQRLTESVGQHVLVTGHPFVDIWAAVRPERLGIRAWPEIPYGEDWKTGVCRRLGWGDPREGFHRVYAAVSSYKDLDPTLIGAVERLVDFVTVPQVDKSDLI